MTGQLQSTDELIDLVSRSQVIDPDLMWRYLAEHGGAAGLPSDATAAAEMMVRDGLMSAFQAELLLQNEPEALELGKYRLVDRLGPLQSLVFLGERRNGKGRVAIKLLSAAGDTVETMRFRREAQALARLDHPGIVSIKDSGEEDGRLFLAMELIEGHSVAELVQRDGPMAPAPAVRILVDALHAVAHIHQCGMVHRDLRPEHLMVQADGKVRVLDLGLALFHDDQASSITDHIDHGQALGAVQYISPEQIHASHEVDERTDIYSLGATLYFMLTGQQPFSEHALLRLAAGSEMHPTPLTTLRPGLPPALVHITEQMMALDVEARYPTAADAAVALQNWLLEVAPPPMQAPHRTVKLALPEPREEPSLPRFDEDDLVMEEQLLPEAEEPEPATAEKTLPLWVAVLFVGGLLLAAGLALVWWV